MKDSQLYFQLGPVNVLTAIGLVIFTTSVFYGISTKEMSNMVLSMKQNADDVADALLDKNMETAKFAISLSVKSLEEKGQRLMRLVQKNVLQWLETSLLNTTQLANTQAQKWAEFLFNGTNYTSETLYPILRYTTAIYPTEPLTYSAVVYSNAKFGWGSEIPAKRGVRLPRPGILDLCRITTAGDVYDCCATGYPCNVSLTNMALGKRQNFLFSYFSNSPERSVWVEILIISAQLSCSLSTSLRKNGYYLGGVSRDIRMEKLSKAIVSKVPPQMIVLCVEWNGLIIASTHGDITYKSKFLNNTDLANDIYIFRVHLTNSSDYYVRTLSTALLNYYGYLGNASGKDMLLINLGINGSYYASVSEINHINLKWYIVSILPQEYLMGSVKQVLNAMASINDQMQKSTKKSIEKASDDVNKKLSATIFVLSLVLAAIIIVNVILIIIVNKALISGLIDMTATISSELGTKDNQKVSSNQKVSKRSKFTEIHQLTVAYSKFVLALKSFCLYVPPPVVIEILKNDKKAQLGLRKSDVTIMFMDIAGFTDICEILSPMDVQSLLSLFIETMTSVITKNSGTIDKYIGDSIMAFWNEPEKVENHPDKAVRAVLSCLSSLPLINRTQTNYPDISLRAGLTTGDVLVGNLGSSRRFNYTVLGDNVNIASRLCSLNKQLGTNIICTKEMEFRNINAVTRYLGDVVLIGRSTPLPICELLCLPTDSNVEIFKAISIKYYQALENAVLGNTQSAISTLEKIQNDKVSDLLLQNLKKSLETGGKVSRSIIQASKS